MIYYILFFIILMSFGMKELMIKKGKMIRKSKKSKLFNWMGIVIPFIIMVLYYFYFETDTLSDWMIVSMSLFSGTILVYLMGLFSEKSNKVYYFMPLIFFAIAGLYVNMLRHVINPIMATTCFGICGSLLGVNVQRMKAHKSLKIVLNVSAIVILLFVFNGGGLDSKKQVKPILKVMDYIEAAGAVSYPNDFYFMSRDNNRRNPIEIILYTVPEGRSITRKSKFEYHKGWVTLIESDMDSFELR